MTKRKLDNIVEIVVCEFHQEVLPVIHRRIARKKLPFSGMKMIHFDAHPDLSFPQHLRAEQCYSKEMMYETLEIADWIMPLMYAGHLEKFIWVRSPWSEQIPDLWSTFEVGEDKSTKQLKVTCKEDYFLEENMYSPSNCLSHKQLVQIQVCPASRFIAEDCTCSSDNETSAQFNSSKTTLKVDRSPLSTTINNLLPLPGEIYVLDIDLDYFSVMNPFLQFFSKEKFATLKQLYSVSFPSDKSNQDEVLEAMKKARVKLRCLQADVKSFASGSVITKTIENEDLLALLSQIKKEGDQVDWEMVHTAGATTDLPHHVSSEKEIYQIIDEMVALLKRLPPPALITIARSSEDEYCPPFQVEMILTKVINALRQIYPDTHVTYDYSDANVLHT